MVLSVEDILNGVEEYKEIFIESIGDRMYLRPLSKGEWERTNSIRQESLGDYVTNEKAKSLSRTQRVSNIESQLKFNIKDNNDADFKAQIEAIYLSLDNGGYDKPTPKEKIKALPSDVFNEIYSKVKEISGINDDFAQLEEDVEDFPEN